MLAFPLASFFLTLFVYGVLFSVFQSKKTEQFWNLKRKFLETCSKACQHLGKSEHHYSLAGAALKLTSLLQNQEWHFYPLSSNPLVSKLSFQLHWKDVLKMKEVLYLSAIDHYTELLKTRPIDVELHTHLANSFVDLSRLYLEPKLKAEKDELFFSSKSSFALMLERKFEAVSKSAVEEFKILNAYAPNDPWVHAQLAGCYHRLHMFKEQAMEYEKIIALSPEDHHTMFRLAKLYFHQGQSAKALKLYDHLKRMHFERADELLDHYDAFLKKAMLAKSVN